MATFRAYAKVLEPDDPTMRIYQAGLPTCPGPPGLLLADVLRRTGGVYHTRTPLIPHLRDDIRGRVFGVLNVLVSIFSLLPLIFVGPIADVWGVAPVFVLGAVVVFAVWFGGRKVRLNSSLQ